MSDQMKLTTEQMLGLAKKHGFTFDFLSGRPVTRVELTNYTNAVLALRDEEAEKEKASMYDIIRGFGYTAHSQTAEIVEALGGEKP